MPWRIMSTVDERKKFVDEALNIHRHTSSFEIYVKIITLALKQDINGSIDFEKMEIKVLKIFLELPFTQPNKISNDVKSAIIGIRQQFPKWGPKKIRAELLNHYDNLPVPSEASIGNILSRNQFIKSPNL